MLRHSPTLRTPPSDIRIGSLFSGYGGLDAAALAIIGEHAYIAWHSDIKPASVALLAARDPGVPNLGDIHRIDADAPPVDALTFGWPCQPHSSAGKRLGEADPRALWPEVARIIAALRPRHLFGENVARVASNGELRRVVTQLAQLGYLGTYRTLRASDVGAPHRRDRLFLYAVDGRAAADTDSAPGRLAWLPQPADRGGEASAGHAGSGGCNSAAADTEGVGWVEGRTEHVEPQRASAATSGDDTGLTLLPTPSARNGRGIDQRGRPFGGLDLQTTVALLPTPAVADSRSTRNATAGRSAGQEHHHSGWTLSDVAHADRWGTYAVAIARWEHVTGRAAPEPTVPNTKGNPALSPRFVEWMQGLPPSWVDLPELSRSQQLSLLGDGVVPQQAIAAFTELVGRMVSRETERAS